MTFKQSIFPNSRIFLYLLICFTSLSYEVCAVPIYFTDEALYNTAIAEASFSDAETISENFETVAPFGERVGGGVSQYSLSGVQLQSPLPAIKVLSRNYSGSHNTTAGGRNYLSIDSDLRGKGTSVSLDFEGALQTIGFYLIDHDASDLLVSMDGIDYVVPEVSDGDIAFFGLIFSEISSVPSTLLIDTGRDAQIALDDLRFSFWSGDKTGEGHVSVDEPDGLGLMLVVLLLLSFLQNRQAIMGKYVFGSLPRNTAEHFF